MHKRRELEADLKVASQRTHLAPIQNHQGIKEGHQSIQGSRPPRSLQSTQKLLTVSLLSMCQDWTQPPYRWWRWRHKPDDLLELIQDRIQKLKLEMFTKCKRLSIETTRKSFKPSTEKPSKNLKEFNKSIKKYCWNRRGNITTVDSSNLVCMMISKRISIELMKTL
jgi:hypothetical protein